jgi:membrane protease YdiL (CAAX protease family)
MLANFSIYLIVFAAFIMLLVSQAISAVRKSYKLEDVIAGAGNMDALINKNLIGISVLGSAVLFSVILQEKHGFWLLPTGEYKWFITWGACIAAAVFFGLFIIPGKGPAINKPIISADFFPSPVNFYFLSRILFLIVYEFFFRGVMFENIQGLASTEWSIIFNIVAYSAAHINDGKKEKIGTVPFGLLLCILTIKLQSVWPAVSVHLALALSYEVKLINYQKARI